MWEFTKIFSSSDNLFKFLFVGGISMVFVAMFYPLRKQHELEIQTNQFEMEKALLSMKILDLEKKVNSLKALDQHLNKQLDSLNKLIKKSTKTIQIQKLKLEGKKLIVEFDEKNLVGKNYGQDLSIDNIKLKYSGKAIDILQQQSNSYKSYTCLLKTLGWLTFLIGLIGWCYATYKTEKLREQQIEKNQRDLDKGKKHTEETETPVPDTADELETKE